MNVDIMMLWGDGNTLPQVIQGVKLMFGNLGVDTLDDSLTMPSLRPHHLHSP